MAWYDSSWGHRVKITVDHTKLTADVTGFPVYVDLSNLPSGFFTNVKSDGGDIRVTTSDGTTECPIEVVAIDTAGSTGELHFKGDVSSSVDTDFYIYYGNSGASGYSANATYGSRNVWDSSFVAVYHMQQDPSAGNILDSTNNANSAVPSGTWTSANLASGNIGKALNFNGTDGYLSTSLGGINAPYSVETWVYFNNLNQPNGDYDYLVNLANTGGSASVFSMSRQAGGTGDADKFYNYDGTQRLGPVLTGQAWTHLVLEATTSGNYTALYVNGATATLAASTTALNTSGSLWIGKYGFGSLHFLSGKVSELRVSSNNRSADWIKATYNNQHTPSAFYTVGAQEDSQRSGTIIHTLDGKMYVKSGSVYVPL